MSRSKPNDLKILNKHHDNNIVNEKTKINYNIKIEKNIKDFPTAEDAYQAMWKEVFEKLKKRD